MNGIIKIPVLLFVALSFFRCNEKETPCPNDPQHSEEIGTYEAVGDTTFVTDTLYQYRPVYFKSPKEVMNALWKIGDDPREFTQNSFFLVFNQTGSYNVKLSGIKSIPCSSDKEVIDFQDTFTIVPNNFISPLPGKYIGKNSGENNEYTIEIKYWIGDRYPWWKDGAYSIHNFPEGYRDTTHSFNGYLRPEVDGIVLANGFNSFYVDMAASIPAKGVNGYGLLNGDDKNRIEINFKIIDMVYYDQTKTIKYVDKKFIGSRIK